VVRHFSGFTIRRVIDRSHTRVPEHAHDWPLLSLFVMGSYLNETEAGRKYIAGPSAIFYRAGAAHRNTIAATGFEQIEIELDPAWLDRRLLPTVPVVVWAGGRTAESSRALARLCGTAASEEAIRTTLHTFLVGASRQPAPEPASWIETITRRIQQDPTLQINDLSKEVDRHPSWVGHSYRKATGEGLKETAARFRVECATRLLRETEEPLASVAFAAGFCDQSHMNRSFRRILGRSPAAVREERREFRCPSPRASHAAVTNAI
jgi:AraC family transcriptional regulator